MVHTREQRVLREFLVEVVQFCRTQPREPATGSPADLLNHPERALKDFRTGLALIDSAVEHVSLFLDALDDPRRLLAACSCARVALELSARVLWLLDPELEPAEHHARMCGHRHIGILQHMKFQRSQGESVDQHEQWISELAEEATQFRVDVGREPNGRITTIGKVATSTELVSKLKAESMYRLLSAAVHGHYWAIDHLSRKRVSDERLSFLVGAVALEFSPGPAALADYMGWQSERMNIAWSRLQSGLRLERMVAQEKERQGDVL